MKEEYKDIINSLYKIYNYNSKYDSYCGLYNKISEYYTVDIVSDESEKEKAERLAIKIAKERNEKIDLLLS